MTTIAQVKRVVQPLLDRNPDLALAGRIVVIKPVRHILRGIDIGRSGDPELFVPTWAVSFLFEPWPSLPYNWGERVYRRDDVGLWFRDHPATPVRMAEEIERQALPRLRPVETLDDLVAFTAEANFPRTPLSWYPLRQVFVDIARGDLEAAGAICAYLASDSAKRRFLPMMTEEYDRVMQRLCPLVAAGDRAGLAKALHEFEAWSVRAMKLDKLWEPTPFPIEQA